MISAKRLSAPGLTIISIALVMWAVTAPRFRDHENFITAEIFLPVTLAIALLILAYTATTSLRAAAAWSALLLAGQASALQLVAAGKSIGYQHYRTIDTLATPTDLFCIIFILIQGCIVAVALRRSWQDILEWLRSTFRSWQLGLFALLMLVASAAPSLNLGDFGLELVFALFIQLINLATLFLAIRSIPPDFTGKLKTTFHTLFGDLEGDSRPDPGGIDRFPVLVSFWVICITILLSIFVYENHPHIPDEVIYLIQAEYFSKGMLTLPLPPVVEAFDLDLMYYGQERWYSPFPPGWPAMLAVGSYFGAPWLVNPLLAGINILLAYVLAREIYSRGTARLVVILMGASPWFIFMGMNFMAHTFTLSCVLSAAYAVARMRRSPNAGWALLAGAMIGLTSLIRPLDGIIVALALGLWALGMKTWRTRLTLIPVLVLGSMAVGAITLPYNSSLTGHAGKFPVMLYFDKYYGPGSNSLGFGADKGVGWTGLDPFPGHGLPDVILNNYLNTFSVNIELFGWITGSLFLILALFISGAARRKDYWMLSVMALVAGLHSLYWFNGGPDFGARYWYLILFPAAALSAQGIRFMGIHLNTASEAMTKVTAAILVLCLAAAINFIPWRAVDKYHQYRGMHAGIRHLDNQYDFSDSIVLVNGKRFPDYMSAATYNTADLSGNEPVFAWDRSQEIRHKVLRSFPGKTVWLVEGPTITGEGFRVAEGPLTAEEILQRTYKTIDAGE